jgi:hypothetical protein
MAQKCKDRAKSISFTPQLLLTPEPSGGMNRYRQQTGRICNHVAVLLPLD